MKKPSQLTRFLLLAGALIALMAYTPSPAIFDTNTIIATRQFRF